jgi:hypothetical protein
MASFLFVTQTMIDSWMGQGKIDFSGTVMTLLSGEGKGRTYTLQPALRFMKLVGSESDPHKLLAKVKTPQQLKELGAELMGDSAIVGDIAYEVQQGFLAEMSALQAAAGAAASATANPTATPSPTATPTSGPAPLKLTNVTKPAPKPEPARDVTEEADMLADFLLDKLN